MDGDQPANGPADDKNQTFRTPDEVAAKDQPLAEEVDELDTPKETGGDTAPQKPKTNWKEKMKLHWPPGKKEWTIIILLLLLIGGGAYALVHHKEPATLQAIPKTPETTVPSKLSGLPVDPIVNKRTVTGVMIENSPDARPQSGLGQASVVFEAIAEGGITRFLALFQDTAPDNVGPIRSARPYYEQWNLGFDAGYAHVGGSPEALADIKAWGVRDLDQFANSGSYHRVNSRRAPHNVYTSITALNQLEVQKGYVTSNFNGFVRKKKATPDKSKPPAARIVNIGLSGPTYNVQYTYDPATNSYQRNEGGVAHIDANTNQQIRPTVVIALIMPYSIKADGYHSNYSTLGSGPTYVFQDGNVTAGTWTKTDNASQFKFTDAAGKTIPLNPGTTWLTAVSGANKVSSTP